MNPLVGATAISAGSGFLEGIGDWLTGGADRDWQKKLRQYAESLKGQKITDQQISGLTPFIYNALSPIRNATANQVSARYGVDSGVAGAEIMKAGWPQLQEALARLKEKQIMENFLQPFRVGQLMASAR